METKEDWQKWGVKSIQDFYKKVYKIDPTTTSRDWETLNAILDDVVRHVYDIAYDDALRSYGLDCETSSI
jgi:hypothetical protein